MVVKQKSMVFGFWGKYGPDLDGRPPPSGGLDLNCLAKPLTLRSWRWCKAGAKI